MASKVDLRVIKTKNSLRNAFFALLEENCLEDITINELCVAAGVRRATFYKHFADKSDFINDLIKDVRERFDCEFFGNKAGSYLTKEYYTKYVESVVAFLLSREQAIRKMLKSSMRAQFIDIFMEQNYIDTRARLEESVKRGMRLSSSVDVTASMLIGGISHNIIRWFESDEKESMTILLQDISKFLDANMK